MCLRPLFALFNNLLIEINFQSFVFQRDEQTQIQSE